MAPLDPAKGKQEAKGQLAPVHPPHLGAGDNHDDDEEEEEEVTLPRNIVERINALKHIHMDIQKVKMDMHTKLFTLEAEYHKKMIPLLKKRADIINGVITPTEQETKFLLKDGETEQTMGEANEEKGIPEFWKAVLMASVHTEHLISEKDSEVLTHLTDIRVVYSEKPLGFSLEFEFAENPFFHNNVLTRSYEFKTDIDREELYHASGLSPSTTNGTVINWKEGKNTTRTTEVTFQRNKKTGQRRQVTNEIETESFFTFFSPKVEDLSSLSKSANAGAGDAAEDDKLDEQAEQAELDFEMASYIRTRVVPRALLIFTGQDGEDDDFDDEDDFDEEDEDGDEDDSGESDESDDAPPAKKPDTAGQGSKQAGSGGKQQKGPRKS
ncbi:hypothetical protein RvY_09952 [Ramazzottius varieornatus]|uniref:Nucleosome assembly protein n=1 Tax=Ramazzottius varieornatus TaxID=947166 RepID=A0A1D1VK46_RAMVA|nr:hypothetical protein RvY_09952 [Ramazzottius varieornatus]